MLNCWYIKVNLSRIPRNNPSYVQSPTSIPLADEQWDVISYGLLIQSESPTKGSQHSVRHPLHISIPTSWETEAKRAKHEAGNSPASIAEVKNARYFFTRLHDTQHCTQRQISFQRRCILPHNQYSFKSTYRSVAANSSNWLSFLTETWGFLWSRN